MVNVATAQPINTVMGLDATAGDGSTAIGPLAFAGNYSVAISAVDTDEYGSGPVSFGANAPGLYSIAIGIAAFATENESIAIGTNSTSKGMPSVSIGSNSIAWSGKTIAIGTALSALARNSIAIGVMNQSNVRKNGTIIPEVMNPPIDPNDPIFMIGNGNSTRSNALTLFRDGSLRLPSLTGTGTTFLSADSQGTIARMASPTTVAGYGITDALTTSSALNADLLTAGTLPIARIAAASVTNDKLATNPLARANHTGTQAWITLTGTPTTVSGYGITDAVTRNASGNVGIGNTAPTEKLDVTGNAKVSGTLTVAGQTVLTTNGSGTNLTALDASKITIGNLPAARIAAGTLPLTSLATNPLARANHTGTQDWATTISGKPTTTTGYGITDAVTRNASGNVGIGASATALSSAWKGTGVFGQDTYNKVVVGPVVSTYSGATVGAHNSTLTAWAELNVTGSNLLFRSNGESETARLTSTGNLGVGTTAPVSRLTLAGGGNPNPNTGLEMDYTGQSLTFQGINTGGTFTLGGIKMVQPNGYFVDAADMVFSTASGGGVLNEVLRINRGGNLGIGTNNPTAKLDVNGNAKITGTLTVGGQSVVTATQVAAGYQPLDSDLTALAALTTTAFGRGLLDDADAAAARATLGLGGAATAAFGTAAGTVAAGNDSRITSAVPKTRSISTNAPLTGGGALSGNLTLGISVATTTADGAMSATDKTKLQGIATGATANLPDATLLARANHTGTQAWSTLTATPTTVSGYRITDAVTKDASGNVGITGTTTLTGAVIAQNDITVRNRKVIRVNAAGDIPMIGYTQPGAEPALP